MCCAGARALLRSMRERARSAHDRLLRARPRVAAGGAPRASRAARVRRGWPRSRRRCPAALAELAERDTRFAGACCCRACSRRTVEPAPDRRLQLRRFCSRAARDAAEQLDGGFAALSALLVDSIRTHSGELRLIERAAQIVRRRRRARSAPVRFGRRDRRQRGRDRARPRAAHALARRPHATRRAVRARRASRARLYRYTLNVVVRNEALARGHGARRLLRARRRAPRQADNVLHVEVDARSTRAHPALCARRWCRALERGARRSLDHARERVHRASRRARAVRRASSGPARLTARRPPPCAMTAARSRSRLASAAGRPRCPCVHAYPAARDVCARYRCDARCGACSCATSRSCRASASKAQLLAASVAARVACRADRNRDWMRKRLWTKVEI